MGMNRMLTFAATLVSVWIIGYLLIAGRGLVIPIVIALFVWNLLNTFHNALHHTPVLGPWLPRWLGWIFSLLVVMVLVKILLEIIGNNVNAVMQASPRYQENLTHIFNTMDEKYHFKSLSNFDGFLKTLNLQNILLSIYGVFSTLTSSAVLITLYIVFLFVEQHYFQRKLDAFFPRADHRKLVNSIITHIAKDTQTYLGIKTLLSLLTAIASWLIMKWIHLDFAEFWALLIFFLSYIPNIGAIVATAFPALLALIQFQSWIPFIMVTSGIVVVQFVIGNLVEPRFLSKSLNLSPLVILFALSFWGAIWGILGMFLSVPITVIMMIVFAHFDVTRPIAILLSQDGFVKNSYDPINVS
jgi:predicted PurR-regulated permease PerM